MKGRAPGEVHLIGGTYKRSRLPVLQRAGLRPTPARVRETLFNWLGQDLSGWRCLDAFAGSGALGFEAASRGAAAVTLVESDPLLVRGLAAVQQRLQATAVTVRQGDGLAALHGAAPASLDLVLLDPPFGSDLLAPALRAAARALAPGGFVHAEDAKPITEWPPGLQAWRSGRAGQVHHVLLRATGTLNPMSEGAP